MKVVRTNIDVHFEEQEAVMLINSLITLITFVMNNTQLTKLIKDSFHGDKVFYSIIYEGLPKDEAGKVKKSIMNEKIDDAKAVTLVNNFIGYFGAAEIIQNVKASLSVIEVLSKYLSDQYPQDIYQSVINRFYNWLWSSYDTALTELKEEEEEAKAVKEEVKEEKKK